MAIFDTCWSCVKRSWKYNLFRTWNVFGLESCENPCPIIKPLSKSDSFSVILERQNFFAKDYCTVKEGNNKKMCFLLYSWLTLLLVGCFSGQGYRKKNSVIHHSMSKPWLWVDRCTWGKRCNYKITNNKTIYDIIHRNIVILNKNVYFTSILTNIYILCRYGVFRK